jgi:hypothetical protein
LWWKGCHTDWNEQSEWNGEYPIEIRSTTAYAFARYDEHTESQAERYDEHTELQADRYDECGCYKSQPQLFTYGKKLHCAKSATSLA